MGKKSRSKGKSGELEAVKKWLRWFPNARRAAQNRYGHDGPDVDGTPFWIEVKRPKKLYPGIVADAWLQASAAMEQACEREYIPDLMPVLVMTRQDGSKDAWLVYTDGKTLYQMVQYEGLAEVFRHEKLQGEALYRLRWSDFVTRMDIAYGVQPTTGDRNGTEERTGEPDGAVGDTE